MMKSIKCKKEVVLPGSFFFAILKYVVYCNVQSGIIKLNFV